MRVRRAAILVVACALMAAPAFADEVSDQIQQALAAYQQHNTEAALAALDAAAGKLRQARANELKALLPTPPPGWTADPAETSAVSAAMLGGGTTASRSYRMGDQKVDVQITTDSPMLQGMAALISSPLGASSGMKTFTVSGQRVAYTASDNDLMTLVGKAIVKVDGNTQTPEATLRTFLATMDFSALEKIAH